MIIRSLTIANGQTVSQDHLSISSAEHLAGIIVPTSFVGATLAFQGAIPALTLTWFPVHDRAGAAIAVTVAPGRLITLPADLLLGLPNLKIVAAGNQTAARVVQMIFRSYP